MKSWLEMLSFMPEKVRLVLKNFPAAQAQVAEEIRLRTERPLAVITGGKANYIACDGKITPPQKAMLLDSTDINECIRLLSQSSLYAWEEELRQAYVTVKGGHRVGLAGRILTEKGVIRSMKDISSLNFRLARQIPGCARTLANTVLGKRPEGTLLISPPRGGKTTLLRDLIRLTSLQGFTVAVIDERSELGASWQGVPQKDLGPNTDILDACPKAQGMILSIRSLGPEVVAVDEIGSQEDADAIFEAAKAGVAVYATAHAESIDDALRRPLLNKIISAGIFKKIVVLNQLKRGEYVISDFPKGLKAC